MHIERLLVKGWVDDGARRGGDLLEVRGPGKSVAIMCLGHDLVLKIYPKSLSPDSNILLLKIEDEPEQDLSTPDAILSASPPEEKPSKDGKSPRKRRKLNSAQNVNSGATDAVVVPSAATSSAKNPARGNDGISSRGRRKLPPPFVVTLLHGDTLFLSGDDFHYSIVRSGTSILLVAHGQSSLLHPFA
ncbi:hypothetical protein DFH09DRAFT_341098 [Mycena vulgaris]|nr:hypothetical protein DFH09DRAFT_341098 [Mycena vulgaris]